MAKWRIDMARTSERAIYLVSAFAFPLVFAWSFEGSFVPLFAKQELSASILEVGLVALLLNISVAIVSIPAGLATDRWGRHVIFVSGYGAWAAATVLVSLSRAPSELAIAVVLAGVGIGLVDPTMSAYILDVARYQRLGFAFGFFTMSIQFGLTTGPLAGGIMSQNLGYRPAFAILAAILGAVALTAMYLLPRRTSSPSAPSISLQQTYHAFKRDARLGMGWIVIFAGTLLTGSSISFLPLYGQSLGLDRQTIGFILAFQSLASALSRVPLGSMADRTGRDMMIIILGLIAGSSALMLLALSAEPLQITLSLMMLGVGFAAANTLGSVLVSKAAPPSSRGLSMGFASFARFAGFGTGPYLMASTIDALGGSQPRYDLGFIAVGGAGFAMALVLHVLNSLLNAHRRVRNKPS